MSELDQSQTAPILKELSDIKASLAVNTSETANIKITIGEIKADIREIKTKTVSQEQHKELADVVSDHEGRIRSNETNITRVLTFGTVCLIILGLLEFVLTKYF